MFFRTRELVDWIVVFLGNPGLKYERTRHNAGFMTADIMANALGIKIDRSRFNALTAVVTFGDKRVLLMKPQTFMNLSGDALRQAIRYYKLKQCNILVVSDDVALPAGSLRIRRNGSAGGHNGLRDIIEKCGGEDFPRIRIGVGAPPHKNYELIDWVLSKLSDEDYAVIADAAARAAAAVEMTITQSIDNAMGSFN